MNVAIPTSAQFDTFTLSIPKDEVSFFKKMAKKMGWSIEKKKKERPRLYDPETGEYLNDETMKAIEDMLPKDRFLRIHRSYIIAVDKIQKVDRNDCVYIGKEIIHIPDGYLQTFRQFLDTRVISKEK